MFEQVNLGVRNDHFGYGVTSQIRLEFLTEQSRKHTVVCKNIKLEMRKHVVDVFQEMPSVLARLYPSHAHDWAYVQIDPEYWIIRGPNVLLVGDQRAQNSRRSWGYDEGSVRVNRANVEVYGDVKSVAAISEALEEKFQDRSFTKITWYYKDGSGMDYRSLYVDQDNKLCDEYYPWFKQGVDSFVEDYLKSPATVLVMYGPPGTGKTSFLKHLICSRKMNAIVSYDEDILRDDRFFIDFLADDDHNLMIIEDADLLLSNRESEQNKIMSKFLNVSDGIVKVSGKKMVFTTNISKMSKVDPALLRKGRCYASVEFRPLNSREAAAAATAAGVEAQNWDSKNEWTLTEIFNRDIDTAEVQAPMGFGFRA